MMKRAFRSLVLVLGLLAAAGSLHAQSYLLMAVSGDVQYGADGRWKKATTGARLAANDQLRIGDRGYAAVVYNNARTFELKRPGTYRLEQLTAGAKTASSSVTSRYLDYVVNRSTSNKLGNNMSNLGAVERSMAPAQLLPRNSLVATDKATLRWEKQPGAPSYILQISNEDGDELLKQEVRDTFAVVDVAALKLQPGVCYFWKVANSRLPGMTSDELCFRVMEAAQQDQLRKGEAEILQDMTEESASRHLVLANFYKDLQVNDAAMTHFEQAIALAPDVKEYRLMYAEYLQSVGLTAKAQQVAKSAE